MATTRWIWVVPRIYVYADDARERVAALTRRFPSDRFRVGGSATIGYGVQRQVKIEKRGT